MTSRRPVVFGKLVRVTPPFLNMYNDRLCASSVTWVFFLSKFPCLPQRVAERSRARLDRRCRRCCCCLGLLATVMHRRHGFLTSARTDEREVSVFRFASRRTDIAARALFNIWRVAKKEKKTHTTSRANDNVSCATHFLSPDRGCILLHDIPSYSSHIQTLYSPSFASLNGLFLRASRCCVLAEMHDGPWSH